MKNYLASKAEPILSQMDFTILINQRISISRFGELNLYGDITMELTFTIEITFTMVIKIGI